MKMNKKHSLKPKAMLLGALLLCLNTMLPAQNLYVQAVGSEEPAAFELAQKPKITFNARVMTIETPAGDQSFALNEIQGLSFVKNAQSGAAVVDADPIRLYPNPVKDELELNVQIPTKGLTYRIYDLSGKLIQSKAIRSATTKINVKTFPTGVYVFKLEQNGKEIQSFKIVKQ